MAFADIPAFGPRAHASCAFCSHQKFRIVIFDKGGWEPRCSKCRQAWQAPEQPEAFKLDGDAAVEGGGAVAAHVVPPPSREEGEEGLNGSQEPWLSQGVSRSTYFRRRAKLAAVEANAKRLRQRVEGKA